MMIFQRALQPRTSNPTEMNTNFFHCAVSPVVMEGVDVLAWVICVAKKTHKNIENLKDSCSLLSNNNNSSVI